MLRRARRVDATSNVDSESVGITLTNYGSVSGFACHLPDAAAQPPSALLLRKDPQTRPCHLFLFAALGAKSMESQTADRKAEMHQPGIEPESHRWQRCILPLDH